MTKPGRPDKPGTPHIDDIDRHSQYIGLTRKRTPEEPEPPGSPIPHLNGATAGTPRQQQEPSTGLSNITRDPRGIDVT